MRSLTDDGARRSPPTAAGGLPRATLAAHPALPRPPPTNHEGPHHDRAVQLDAPLHDLEDWTAHDGLEGNKGQDAPIRHAQRHARGVRRVEKAILKDLWRAARDLYAAAGWDVSDTDVITSSPLAA